MITRSREIPKSSLKSGTQSSLQAFVLDHPCTCMKHHSPAYIMNKNNIMTLNHPYTNKGFSNRESVQEYDFPTHFLAY